MPLFLPFLLLPISLPSRRTKGTLASVHPFGIFCSAHTIEHTYQTLRSKKRCPVPELATRLRCNQGLPVGLANESDNSSP